MSNNKKLHFETLQLHVGQEQPDPATDARAVPIYQTTSYVFRNSQHAADRFALRDAGNIYGRLTNSTQGVFEDRVAALEGGVAGLAVGSGAAAVTYALQNIVQNGDHIVAADNLYGGSFNLITHTLSTQGISNTIVKVNDLEALEAAIQPNTKAVYAETFGNPNSDVTDIEGVQEGDVVTLLGGGIGVNEYADLARLNRNEALARTGRRVPRVYLDGGKVVDIACEIE
jgi:O-acetylhomoserine (thiol)-lyase